MKSTLTTFLLTLTFLAPPILTQSPTPTSSYRLFCKDTIDSLNVNCAASATDTPDLHRLTQLCPNQCICLGKETIACEGIGDLCDGLTLDQQCLAYGTCYCFAVGADGGSGIGT